MTEQNMEPHTITLPPLACDIVPDDPHLIVSKWTAKFEKILAAKDTSALKSAFQNDAWLRDFLALSWSFRTINGLDNLVKYFDDNLNRVQLCNLRPRSDGPFQPHFKKVSPNVQWVESMFDFETTFGRGSGMLRLVGDANGEWKSFLINFTLQELKGFEEKTYLNRPHGGSNSLVEGVIQENWFERRQRNLQFVDSNPAVLIIGADQVDTDVYKGQSGLSLGARLGQLGTSALIIDKNQRIGDNWRNRYRTLVTHDPVQYSHLPYLPFPPSWPMFTPKDKLADWFEAYASLMELNVWMRTTVDAVDYDEASRIWTVALCREDGSTRVIYPQHVVLATGQAGEAKIPSFPNQENFNGMVYHTSQHQDASLAGDVSGKKVVVVGSGNSGHDICQNYYEKGADVTMLQRGGTYVITAKKGLFMLHKGVYEDYGPPVEDADILSQSIPIPVQFALNVHGTMQITHAEKEHLDGLAKAGFKLDFGHDGSGIYRKYITRGGGYYIDVGCSQLIIDGKIQMCQSPDGIQGFSDKGLVLADRSNLEADIVVLATGYDNMKTTARKILGDNIADKLHDVWDLNEEGEVNAVWEYFRFSLLEFIADFSSQMWRDSGHPGFWYMGGSLALSRSYSRFLALQIKALEEGIYTQS
ncbi:hypothetical protein FQN50_006990 [Emmonsiellopsis sp. PD_5]|nr:hypothetical protein FQN50_006990 [Emmonsiellopsis sp. PD_5]